MTRDRLVRGARIVALAIVIGWSVANAIQRIGDWSLSDMDAYWNAAMRLRDGLPLYPAVPDPGAADVFRYAPWFAWAWVPLTFLPKAGVAVAWSALLVGASGAAVMPILRQPSLTRIGAAALLGTILLWSAASGNVQPLLVAVLVFGVEGRGGPLWIAIAASLKIFPIGFALVYAGRRDWRRFVVAIVTAAILWLPAFAYDLRAYQTSVLDSPNPLMAIGAWAYAIVVAIAAVITVLTASTRFGCLAAAVTVIAAIPRLSLIELSYLAVGVPSRAEHRTMGLRAPSSARATVPHALAWNPLSRPNPTSKEPSNE